MDAVINVALEEARDCLWRTDQERAIPVNQKGNPAEGRMDWVCWPSGTASGKPISFDVTVVSPSAAGVVVKNSKQAGWAVEVAEEVKRSNGYGPFVKQQGHRFFGAGIATSGYFGTGFLQFRKQIHNNVPRSSGKEFDLDPGTNLNVQHGVDRTFWFVPSRFDYYTARIAVALKIALVRQTNDVLYANIDKRALSSRPRADSNVSRANKRHERHLAVRHVLKLSLQGRQQHRRHRPAPPRCHTKHRPPQRRSQQHH